MNKSCTKLPIFIVFLMLTVTVSSCKNNKENEIAQDETLAENQGRETSFRSNIK